MTLALTCVITTASSLLVSVWRAPILLVWNVSSSAPRGLYGVMPTAAVRRGDVVIARLGQGSALLAARRHYLPLGVPLVKRVAALDGDRVCAQGPIIRVNGQQVAVRRSADAAGRTLPWWTGCTALGLHDYFLLGDGPSSFDGRYFGIVRQQQIIGQAKLLLRR